MLGRLWQPVERPDAVRALGPAGKRLVDRLARLEDGEVGRHVADGLALALVGDAHLDLGEAIEHVQLREREGVEAVHAHRIAHDHGVEPAAAARAPGDGAELAATLAQRLADVVFLLGRKRPAADPCGVGLADAEHVADRARAEPRPGRRLRRHRVGRGDERIGAVVDVEQRALRAFEQNPLAFTALAVEQRPYRAHVG